MTKTLITLLLLTTSVYATEVKVLSASKSGKLFLVNVGEDEMLQLQTEKFFSQNGTSMGPGKVIKIYKNQSVWEFANKLNLPVGTQLTISDQAKTAEAPKRAPASVAAVTNTRKASKKFPHEENWTAKFNEEQKNPFEKAW